MAKRNPSSSKTTTIKINPGTLISSNDVVSNLGLKVLVITEDKLRLCWKNKVEKAVESSDWKTPLSVLVTLVATFCTTTFREISFINKEALWLMAVVVFTIISIWLIYAVVKNARKVKMVTEDEFIQELMKNSVAEPAQSVDPVQASVAPPNGSS